MFAPSDFLDLQHCAHSDLFADCTYVWDALKKLNSYFNGHSFDRSGSFTRVGNPYIDSNVIIGDDTLIEDGAMILGPAIIGSHCHIRHGAYIRDHVLIGNSCVIGNACEVKHSILLDGCEVPHFNYVGDSILGVKAHLGAGAKISNAKLDQKGIRIKAQGREIETGLKKFGAIIGDYAQIGCNAVLNPGSLIGRSSRIYPCVSWRGFLPPEKIAKENQIFDLI
jgi:NDP-sugar pyrophosphorylase family protein